MVPTERLRHIVEWRLDVQEKTHNRRLVVRVLNGVGMDIFGTLRNMCYFIFDLLRGIPWFGTEGTKGGYLRIIHIARIKAGQIPDPWVDDAHM